MSEPKLIKTWKELIGLESDDNLFKITSDTGHSAWIEPISETDETKNEKFWETHQYLSTHTFYGLHYKESTEILQKFGFNIEIDNWDKEVF